MTRKVFHKKVEIGQRLVGQLSKSNRQQAGDELGVVIRQQPADEKGQQVADQLEMLNVFGTIAIKRVFLQSKTKQNAHKQKQTAYSSQILSLYLGSNFVNLLHPIGFVRPAETSLAYWDFELSSI
jgi:hypothetical protein